MRPLILTFLMISTATVAFAADAPPAWDDETIRLFSTLPIQSGGRVKPLDTYAGYELLQINGRRKCQIAPSTLLFPLSRMVYPNRGAMAWFLDALFYPECAREYPSFLVSNSDAFVALGAIPINKKRGRFTYVALEPARDRIFELASMYAGKPARELDVIQREILRVAQNIHAFEQTTEYLDFARHTFTVGDSRILAELFAGKKELRLSEVLARGTALQQRLEELMSGRVALDEDTTARETKACREFYAHLQAVRAAATSLALFPGPEAGAPWLTVGDVIDHALDGDLDVRPYLDWIAQLEAMAAARDNRPDFHLLLRQFHTSIVARAKAHGEYGKIELEAAYYRARLFYRSFALYVLCFILIALSWLLPRNRAIHVLAPVALGVPTALLIAGIVLRCIIRSRPPVTTLYETILFVTAVSIVLALFAEYVSRQRIALAVGGILGVLGMLLANKYEVSSAEDTMPTMVAVLDTNFWLTAHVTTIIVGYAASLLTGALAHIYLFARLFNLKRDDPAFYKTLSRMVYGMLCFGFFFTFMGTVLGGIWANESWGRFWGWDPKENGALLIVLWQLATLHARMGGYIRDLGLSLAAIFGAEVVAFSWWGVNLLGVGLHSYGFTSGAMTWLVVYWTIETFVLTLGGVVWTRERPTAQRPG